MKCALHHATRFGTIALLLTATTWAQTKVHDARSGSQTFATNCSGCHGSDGRGGERAPNIATLRNIIAMSDGDLQRVVDHGVPGAGMPSFHHLGEQGIGDVVAYLRLLQGVGEVMEKVAGDSRAGRTVFFWQGRLLKVSHDLRRRRIYRAGS